MNTWRKKIALFIARRKYFNRTDEIINFNKFIARSNSYLIIFPENYADINAAMDVQAHFKLNKKEVSIIHSADVKLDLREDVSEFIYSKEDISKLKLPRKEFLHKLTSKQYDVVIDLNLQENFFLSVIARSVKGKIIIGFKKEDSDEFYNFQVANNQNNAEISYRNLLNSLLMF